MHIYKRHIGDYSKDTGHLSLLEHGVYTLLMDWCYATERPLPAQDQQIFRICRAFTKEEQRAVLSIVQEFFQQTDLGYIQKRIEQELQEAHARCGKAKESAKARWIKNQSPAPDHADDMPTDSERNADAMRTHSEGTADAQRKQSGRNASRARVHYPVSSIQYPNTGSSLLAESGEGDSSLPLTQAEPPASGDLSGPAKKERGARADLCFEFFVGLTGATMSTVTKAMRGEINAALRDIRAVMPQVTAQELALRASRYQRKWPHITCSPSALAKHWGSLGSDAPAPVAAASNVTTFDLVPADAGRSGPPDGWELAMVELWGADWRDVYAAWDLMPPSDQAQVRRYLADLAKKERGTAA